VPKIKAKLPISRGAGVPAFEISDKDWKVGERALKDEISSGVREQIIEITRIYMSEATNAVAQESAPYSGTLGPPGGQASYSSVVIEQIQEIKLAAAAYHAGIMAPGNLFARYLIAVHLQHDSRIKVKLEDGPSRTLGDFRSARAYPDGMPVLQDANGDLITDSDGNPVPDMKTIAAIGFKFDPSAASLDQDSVLAESTTPSSCTLAPPGHQHLDPGQSSQDVSEPVEGAAATKACLLALRSMALEARAVVRACNDALRVPQIIGADNILHVSSAGFSHIEVWVLWIRQLVALFKAVELPTTVRGDTDKNKSGRQSPFIEFLKWLQSTIPQEYRRRIDDSTLARAVIEARSAPFREPKWSLSDIE